VARVVPWIFEAENFSPRKGRLGGPLPVASGVIIPISGVTTEPQLPFYFRPFLRVMSPHL